MTDVIQKLKKLLMDKMIEESGNFQEQFSKHTLGVDWLVEMHCCGQMVRGMLTLLSYYMCVDEKIIEDKQIENIVKPVLPLAVGLEFIQTAIVIQDDVIDGSDTRRKRKSIHKSFVSDGNSQFYNKETEGNGAAYLLSAACFSYGLQLIFKEQSYKFRLREEVYKMLYDTVLGEALDILTPLDDRAQMFENTSRENIALAISLQKTAIYSFSFPLSSGLILTGKGENEINAMKEIGKNLGLVYQLDNDLKELKIMQQGSHVSSDVIRYRVTYANALAMTENAELKERIWKHEKNYDDIEMIKENYPYEKVKKEVLEEKKKHLDQALQELSQLNLGDEERKAVLQSYVLSVVKEAGNENG